MLLSLALGLVITSGATPPSTTLANNVTMPQVLLGMGLWCNDNVRCPLPKPPCRPCYNNSLGEQVLTLALSTGFSGVDTARGYGNQIGVGAAVRASKQPGSVFVQTKIPGCKDSMSTQTCMKQTAADLQYDIDQLALGRPIDSVLLHSPPINSTKGDACAGPLLCGLAQTQWSVLELAYAAGKVRAIGVSNYCSVCLECLKHTAKVFPMVNQVQYHAGMPGADPTGLISYMHSHGVVPQAYSPLVA